METVSKREFYSALGMTHAWLATIVILIGMHSPDWLTLTMMVLLLFSSGVYYRRMLKQPPKP